jgi:hypothetical protein
LYRQVFEFRRAVVAGGGLACKTWGTTGISATNQLVTKPHLVLWLHSLADSILLAVGIF